MVVPIPQSPTTPEYQLRLSEADNCERLAKEYTEKAKLLRRLAHALMQNALG